MLKMQQASHEAQMRSRDEAHLAERRSRDAIATRIIRGYQLVVAAVVTILAGKFGAEAGFFGRLFGM